ncbi:M48 family metallopeptidase [Mesorhizobium australicum]|uniref:Peptidase family M48 n=1 Tax=Mesorhizobium australicum TaxID=536018 RepID=A0A1X7NQT5_9HYPH|nr:M48 family metallopeptidase [Mesorhizobium australicum]SMH40399.1 Peptidase family M48 [Mesorhizobium australicum]
MASEPVRGAWFPPGSSRKIEAAISKAGDGDLIVVAGEAVLARAAPAEIEFSARVGSIPRRLSFPDGSLFETADNDGVDALAGAAVRAAGAVHQLERFRPRLFVFAALVVGLCFLIYRFAVPALVEVAVAITPPVVPQLMSQGALASLDETLLAKSELPEARQASIREGFSALAALTPRGQGGYALHFRKGGSIGPNAFALPDGSIILTDELVALAPGQDAVLGVLAHEIGHVEREHSLRQLYRAAGIAALIMLIGGDIGAGAEDILVQGSALAGLSYSRGQEAEADRSSVELMLRAGKDPAAIVGFLEIMRDKLEKGSGTDFLSTHPATQQRIEAVKAYAEELAKK